MRSAIWLVTLELAWYVSATRHHSPGEPPLPVRPQRLQRSKRNQVDVVVILDIAEPLNNSAIQAQKKFLNKLDGAYDFEDGSQGHLSVILLGQHARVDRPLGSDNLQPAEAYINGYNPSPDGRERVYPAAFNLASKQIKERGRSDAWKFTILVTHGSESCSIADVSECMKFKDGCDTQQKPCGRKNCPNATAGQMLVFREADYLKTGPFAFLFAMGIGPKVDKERLTCWTEKTALYDTYAQLPTSGVGFIAGWDTGSPPPTVVKSSSEEFPWEYILIAAMAVLLILIVCLVVVFVCCRILWRRRAKHRYPTAYDYDGFYDDDFAGPAEEPVRLYRGSVTKVVRSGRAQKDKLVRTADMKSFMEKYKRLQGTKKVRSTRLDTGYKKKGSRREDIKPIEDTDGFRKTDQEKLTNGQKKQARVDVQDPEWEHGASAKDYGLPPSNVKPVGPAVDYGLQATRPKSVDQERDYGLCLYDANKAPQEEINMANHQVQIPAEENADLPKK